MKSEQTHFRQEWVTVNDAKETGEPRTLYGVHRMPNVYRQLEFELYWRENLVLQPTNRESSDMMQSLQRRAIYVFSWIDEGVITIFHEG